MSSSLGRLIVKGIPLLIRRQFFDFLDAGVHCLFVNPGALLVLYGVNIIRGMFYIALEITHAYVVIEINYGMGKHSLLEGAADNCFAY